MPSRNSDPDHFDSNIQLVLTLWTDFLRPERHTFSSSDLEFAKRLETTGDPFQRVVGRLVLLGTNEPEGRGLMDVVEIVCGYELSAFGRYARDVVFLFTRLPTVDLTQPNVVKFLKSATKADSNCRGNVSLVLERVACAEATEILRSLANDENERVQRNAQVAMKAREAL